MREESSPETKVGEFYFKVKQSRKSHESRSIYCIHTLLTSSETDIPLCSCVFKLLFIMKVAISP